MLLVSCDQNIKINDDLSINNNSFYGFNKLETIVIPKLVKSIEEYGFFNCKQLKSVVFSNESSVINIENNSFLFCNN